MTEFMQNQLNLSDSYRSSRNKTAIFCGIGLAWSAAQFEIKKMSLSGIGEVDLSGAYIPLLLAFCALYSFTISVNEYAMQPMNVRRWSRARFDFALSFNLVRGTLLLLAASGLNRSISTAAYIAVAVVLFLLLSMLLLYVGTIALTPLLVFIRKRQGCFSVASRVIEAEAWSRLLLVIALGIALIWIGLKSLYYPPFYTLFWTTPPSPASIWIVIITAISVSISFILQEGYLSELFAFVVKDRKSGTTTMYDADGEVDIVYSKTRIWGPKDHSPEPPDKKVE
jgi:hypothetical protein